MVDVVIAKVLGGGLLSSCLSHVDARNFEASFNFKYRFLVLVYEETAKLDCLKRQNLHKTIYEYLHTNFAAQFIKHHLTRVK